MHRSTQTHLKILLRKSIFDQNTHLHSNKSMNEKNTFVLTLFRRGPFTAGHTVGINGLSRLGCLTDASLRLQCTMSSHGITLSTHHLAHTTGHTALISHKTCQRTYRARQAQREKCVRENHPPRNTSGQKEKMDGSIESEDSPRLTEAFSILTHACAHAKNLGQISCLQDCVSVGFQAFQSALSLMVSHLYRCNVRTGVYDTSLSLTSVVAL